ncbi:TetR/AcrR family transcriptional regulator [Yinghuangia seranimata]|uniref:TetR/AcrR family transcriptional regulator n=1 Tax=Yinghuangia seranimata TaxID=408067 RepID=UPI00248CE21B|nr:TetR/AcrR family transcriptional regulator [Yinghuangia seranimata]MDI2127217.1 TetR/AcrR family transcriptional regulator [Yinghuangia seranimata]
MSPAARGSTPSAGGGHEAVDEFGIPVLADPGSSSQRKRDAIIRAALAVFLEEGYTAASVDAIATRAGVSKPTIYNHFGNKERLFLAVVAGTLPDAFEPLVEPAVELRDTEDLRGDFLRLGMVMTTAVTSDEVMRLRRLVIGEVDRFPQLGHLWLRIGPAWFNKEMVVTFERLVERGLLAIDDVDLAAQQLTALTVGVPQLLRTFQPDLELPADTVARFVTSGIDVFLAAYAVNRTA